MSDSESRSDKVIAVVNSSEDTVEMLRACLQAHGFRQVVTAHARDFRDGTEDFLKFVGENQPALFVYDISIPYERNWRFLQLVLSTEAMQGRRVVLTTTNKSALDSMVGETDAMEVLGKPYDLDQIVRAVEKALEV
jgi:DNA-binding NtrC family response regulator